MCGLWAAAVVSCSQKGGFLVDQEKTGKFIAACRKERGYTQAALGEKLGVTDRAVSKWETGRSLPDVSLMLPLCGLLGITVNELLAGERIAMEDYKAKAEKTLLELREAEERNNRRMLSLEVVLGSLSTVAALVMVFAASFGTEAVGWRVGLLAAAWVTMVVGIGAAVKIERDAGYYECPHCHARYVPTLRAVVMAPHWGRSRNMRCLHCGEKGYHKKVLTK